MDDVDGQGFHNSLRRHHACKCQRIHAQHATVQQCFLGKVTVICAGADPSAGLQLVSLQLLQCTEEVFLQPSVMPDHSSPHAEE